jgi:hypothetical protein
MTITGSGPGGGIEPTNLYENIGVSCLTLLSGIAWANIIGQICGLAASGDPVQQEFYQTNDDINMLMADTHIPSKIRQEVRMYLVHSKTAMRERNRKIILQNLSPELSGQMATMGQRWIKESMVFWVKDCSTAFLALLITRMDCQAYAPKEVIAANDSMYILKRGTCMTNRLMMKSSKNTVWNMDFVLTSPAMQNVRSMVSGRTLSFCEVDVLTIEVFTNLMMSGFPEAAVIQRKIRWWALLRFIQHAAHCKKNLDAGRPARARAKTDDSEPPSPRQASRRSFRQQSPRNAGGSFRSSNSFSPHDGDVIDKLVSSNMKLSQQIADLTRIVANQNSAAANGGNSMVGPRLTLDLAQLET